MTRIRTLPSRVGRVQPADPRIAEFDRLGHQCRSGGGERMDVGRDVARRVAVGPVGPQGRSPSAQQAQRDQDEQRPDHERRDATRGPSRGAGTDSGLGATAADAARLRRGLLRGALSPADSAVAETCSRSPVPPLPGLFHVVDTASAQCLELVADRVDDVRQRAHLEGRTTPRGRSGRIRMVGSLRRSRWQPREYGQAEAVQSRTPLFMGSEPR